MKEESFPEWLWLDTQFKQKQLDIAGKYYYRYMKFCERHELPEFKDSSEQQQKEIRKEWLDEEPELKKIMFEIYDEFKKMDTILDAWKVASAEEKLIIETKAREMINPLKLVKTSEHAKQNNLRKPIMALGESKQNNHRKLIKALAKPKQSESKNEAEGLIKKGTVTDTRAIFKGKKPNNNNNNYNKPRKRF